MKPKTRTRPPTAAERLAARALGRDEPEEVVEDVRPAGVRLAERLAVPGKPAKPKAMSTAAWHASRYQAAGEDDGPDAA